MKQTITIIGSGLAGCFLAIQLAQRGYKVVIYDRLTKNEIIDSASERSFNLTLYGYGLSLLKKAGLFATIKPHLLPLHGSMTQVGMHSKPILALIDPKKNPYYAIRRATLLKILVEEASHYPNITFSFGKSLTAINEKTKTITIQDQKTKKNESIPCTVIIGADGVNSQVRNFLQKQNDASLSKEYAPWSYKQIFIPYNEVKKLGLRHNIACTWTRKNCVIASFPNKDGSLNAILILPKDTTTNFTALSSKQKIETFIHQYFPQFSPILPTIVEQLLHNREGYFLTIHTHPWYYKDFAALVGDAAHGFYPFFGQGISAAFGDCMEIMRLLDLYGSAWGEIFPQYQKARKRHMDRLGELSKEGFVRYRRHQRADYTSVYERFENLLHQLLPKIFSPALFTSIAFDPAHTDDYYQKHQLRRRIGKMLGIALLVQATTQIVHVVTSLQTVFPGQLKIKK